MTITVQTQPIQSQLSLAVLAPAHTTRDKTLRVSWGLAT